MAMPRVFFPGTVFNNWTAVRFVTKQGNSANHRWLFKCVCGNERILITGSVASGHSKSCGCVRKPSKDQARINLIFKVLKAGAKRRKIPFVLSKSDIANLVEKQNWKCGRTGIPLDLSVGGPGKRMPFGPSIDRINSNLGYEPGNIQLVCLLYNFCKNEFTDADVLKLANALVDNSGKLPMSPTLRIVA